MIGVGREKVQLPLCLILLLKAAQIMFCFWQGGQNEAPLCKGRLWERAAGDRPYRNQRVFA